MSVSALATATGYTKRNVADECETFERAGVLSVRPQGNRFYYSLARRAELAAFVGQAAKVRPNWTALLNVARELVLLEELADGSQATLAVHARKAMRLIDDDLVELGIGPLPEDVNGADLWPAMRQLGLANLRAWSVGHWPPEA